MIRGQKKKINAEIQANIHNRFDIEVIDAKTGEVKQKAQAENIILDQLWNRLLNSSSINNFNSNNYFLYIHYGSGTETPSATDTSLTNFLGCAACYDSENDGSNADITINSDEKYLSVRRKVQLSETTAVGSSISEVGIAYGTGSTTLCTKALLKDMNGNQLVINKTDTDIINIYATVFVHWNDENGIVFNCDSSKKGDWFLSRFLTGIRSKPASSTSYATTWYNDYGSIPNYVKCSSDGNEYKEYQSATISSDVSSKSLTIKAGRLGVNDDNFIGGISKIELQLRGFYYVSTANYQYITQDTSITFNTGEGTWYTGSTVTGEDVGTGDGSTVDFSTDFRIHGDCTIYVDGMAADATVDYDAKITSDSTNIHFATAPAEGSVITATYFTDVIAKDADHVFDFEVTIHLGEKTA